MTRRRGGAAAAALAALVASFVVVVSTSGPASALPDVCSSGNPKVATWIHNSGTAQNWDTPSNWNPVGLPSPDAIACINTTDTVVIGPSIPNITADQVHLAGSTHLQVPAGRSLLINGTAESVWAPGTTVEVPMGEIGGRGTIRAQGDVTFTSGQFGTFLTSVHNGGGQQPPAVPGRMVVEGHATLTNLGLAFSAGYGVTVASGGTFTLAPDAWIAADYGTSLTVQPGGTLDLTGDSDYEQGFATSGQPLSVLTNNGLLRKASGTGTSVVDATYAGSGQVAVLSGTLALPDSQQVGAAVSPGQTLLTGRCDSAGPGCQPTTNPLQDTMSVGFTVPAANAGPAAVQLQELGLAADPAQIGNEVLAHADNLSAAGAPARIVLRFSQPDVMATPLDQVQVVHTTDAGQDVLLPDCAAGTLPAGVFFCVQRPVTRDAQNTYVTVLTVSTSRWHLRRSPAVPDQGAPSPPQGLGVSEATLLGSPALQVHWSPPANIGAGPLSGYRVHVDGQQYTLGAGGPTTWVAKNLGPGKHTFDVQALNALGTSGAVSVATTTADLSKPRKVKAVQGVAGGRLTAGARWRPPAEAGGYKVNRYQVAAFRVDGTKVDSAAARAGDRKLLLELDPGRYFVKVRAHNADGWGPWSRKTDLVRPR